MNLLLRRGKCYFKRIPTAAENNRQHTDLERFGQLKFKFKLQNVMISV